MTGFINEQEGRMLFGANPNSYNDVRPPYPEQVYQFLISNNAIRSNTQTLEIGPGNGLATRRLLDLGANPLTLVEPDKRFSPLLTSLSKSYDAEVHLIEESFEDTRLNLNQYDLVTAATSFHWIQPSVGLAKVADILKTDGYAALWWNVFGDLERDDHYHEATKAILENLASSPSGAPDNVPFALDTEARFEDFSRTGKFENPRYEVLSWTLLLNTQQVGALYSTFSSISRLPEDQQARILHQLMEVAEKQFGGIVERNMLSPIYVVRRKLIAS